MRLVATDSAVDFIQEHGGRLYIWMKRNRCCGGSYSTLGAATAAPSKTEFHCVFVSVARPHARLFHARILRACMEC